MEETGTKYLGTLTGTKMSTFPAGERKLLDLSDEYYAAIEAWKNGDEKALTVFYNKYPEYVARKDVFKLPVQRTRDYLESAIWDRRAQLTDLERKVLDEAIKKKYPDYYTLFINKETRDVAKIPTEQLQAYLELLGGRAPDNPKAEKPLPLPDKALSRQYDEYKQTIESRWGDKIYVTQNAYYTIPESDKAGRKAFREQHPELVEYWDWRREFLADHPELGDLITTSQKETQQYQQTGYTYSSGYSPRSYGGRGGGGYTWSTFAESVGSELTNAVIQYFNGVPLEGNLRARLTKEYKRNRMGYDTLEEWLEFMKSLWKIAYRYPAMYTTKPRGSGGGGYDRGLPTARRHISW